VSGRFGQCRRRIRQRANLFAIGLDIEHLWSSSSTRTGRPGSALAKAAVEENLGLRGTATEACILVQSSINMVLLFYV
jgi:hypothetical protein